MDLKLARSLSHMIFSASGWRGIFAEDGDEESKSSVIGDAHRIIAAAAAKVFSDYTAKLASQSGKGALIVGMDTRPTGSAIADAVIRSLLAENRSVYYAGIIAAPEIMAYAQSCADNTANPVAGFIYISASHNPIGHNGIKFGLTDGGVLQADEADLLILAFHSLLADPNLFEHLGIRADAASSDTVIKVYAGAAIHKEAARTAYRDFTSRVVSGFDDPALCGAFFDCLRKGIKKHPLGIAADFNGSARTLSIDADLFRSLGLGFFAINDKPGQIVHRIVPEGESLVPCKSFLAELHRNDPSVVLAYMPDCDGDRGNLVVACADARNHGETVRILQAQEVFALSTIAELSYLVWMGELDPQDDKSKGKFAVAVNDPTSLRIDVIAQAFGAEVFRAEVGEANVVGLARKLRGEGYTVRVFGEGSAGGTIIHPSAVRDPMTTLLAILKLFAIREGNDSKGGMGIFEIWCKYSGQEKLYRSDFTFADILASLPVFATTGAYTDAALLTVKTADHALLKAQYQTVFEREWSEKKEMLKRSYGISEWEAIAYNGIKERRSISDFGAAGKGGLKIEFRGGDKNNIACIWMRGSGTEPVFRVMADAGGSDAEIAGSLEHFLITWQREMVLEADAMSSNITH